MVARVLFLVLICRGHAITPPAPGDHKGPPFPTSSTLAPTDVDELCVRLMPIGWAFMVARVALKGCKPNLEASFTNLILL